MCHLPPAAALAHLRCAPFEDVQMDAAAAANLLLRIRHVYSERVVVLANETRTVTRCRSIEIGDGRIRAAHSRIRSDRPTYAVAAVDHIASHCDHACCRSNHQR